MEDGTAKRKQYIYIGRWNSRNGAAYLGRGDSKEEVTYL